MHLLAEARQDNPVVVSQSLVPQVQSLLLAVVPSLIAHTLEEVMVIVSSRKKRKKEEEEKEKKSCQ